MKNKIIAHLTIILILVGVFCNVCTTYNRISFYDSSVYAEADNWTSCDSSDLVTAFRYYCKSRNLALEGSVADALTTFTTNTFNNLCSTLGIDPTTLQAEIKKTTQGNLGLRFLFSTTGITAYNRIFAEFLQNNDLSVGDSEEHKIIFSGKSFDGAFIWNFPNGNEFFKESRIQRGTYYKYSHDDIIDLTNSIGANYNLDFSIKGNNYSIPVVVSSYNSSTYFPYSYRASAWLSATNYRAAYLNNFVGGMHTYYTYSGFPALVQFGSSTKLYLTTVSIHYEKNSSGTITTDISNYTYGAFSGASGYSIITIPTESGDIEDNDIYITTNNNTINNNTYNNNYVIIYNDGDTYISDDDDEPLPTTPPDGGGGGGGGDNPDNPDIPSVDPTPTPPPSIPDWDIELPEMPTGNDWLLYGLEKKFPWDIPFNLMYMLSLFAADPETPHFEGTLDLKIVQWNYDIDLAPFDDIAGYVRNIEFIGFLIGLMLLTNKLIWG